MSSKNPYIRTEPYDIDYVGLYNGYHFLHVHLAKVKGMNVIMMRQELSKWIMTRTQSKCYMGEPHYDDMGNLITKDFPMFPPHLQWSSGDLFICISLMIDLVMFQKTFPINIKIDPILIANL